MLSEVGMNDVASLRVRMRALLGDEHAGWPDALLDEGLRQALEEYSQALPLARETVIVLPGPGVEVALDGLDGLIDVVGLQWPYDSLAVYQADNLVDGWYLWRDDGRPVVTIRNSATLAAGDELRVWYTTLHSIEGLDGGSMTSVPADQVGLVIKGALGLTVVGRGVDALELYGQGAGAQKLRKWGSDLLGEFRKTLRATRSGRMYPTGSSWTAAWRMDQWDQR